MKKKLLSALLSVAMVATVLVGCGSATSEPVVEPVAEKTETEAVEETADTTAASEAAGEKDLIVVGYAQVGAESDWRTANTESFKSTFTEENGYQLIFDDAQQKQENQIKAIRSFIQQEVDYIVVAPVVETGWETVLQEAKEAGIPVILSDRQMDVSDDSLYTCWVGGNFIKEGNDAAAWLKEYLAAQGREEEINIVTLQGTIGASAQVGRTDGFAEAMEANWKMLDKQTGEFTQSKGQEGDIIVISFDAVKAAFESMIAGDMNVTVECNPLHGPRVAEIIQTLEGGGNVEKIMYVDEGIFPAETAADIIGSRAY